MEGRVLVVWGEGFGADGKVVSEGVVSGGGGGAPSEYRKDHAKSWALGFSSSEAALDRLYDLQEFNYEAELPDGHGGEGMV